MFVGVRGRLCGHCGELLSRNAERAAAGARSSGVALYCRSQWPRHSDACSVSPSVGYHHRALAICERHWVLRDDSAESDIARDPG